MGQNKTVEELVRAAVAEATSGLFADFELKIQKAFELGAEIGAAKGAEIGAQAALEAAENERRRYRRQRHERQLHDTKLLLQHYRSLNSHYSKAVWEEGESEAEPEELSFSEIMELMDSRGHSDEIIVESISQSARMTRVIMRHVNVMLAEYERMCAESERPDDARHWRVIKALYLQKTRIAARRVAESENIDKRTVYKDVDAAVAELTMLLFGVTGIEKL